MIGILLLILSLLKLSLRMRQLVRNVLKVARGPFHSDLE